MDKEEKRYVILGLIVAIAIGTIFGIFPILDYYNVPPPNLLPALVIVGYVLIVGLLVAVFGLIYKWRKKISISISNKTLIKLNYKIQRELEREAKEKCWLIIQKHLEILPWMTTVLSRDFLQGVPPKNYSVSVGSTIGRTDQHFTVIGERYMLPIPFDEGKGLAEKMSKISHNKKYRQNKLLILMLP